jgi:hypothetical protein
MPSFALRRASGGLPHAVGRTDEVRGASPQDRGGLADAVGPAEQATCVRAGHRGDAPRATSSCVDKGGGALSDVRRGDDLLGCAADLRGRASPGRGADFELVCCLDEAPSRTPDEPE